MNASNVEDDALISLVLQLDEDQLLSIIGRQEDEAATRRRRIDAGLAVPPWPGASEIAISIAQTRAGNNPLQYVKRGAECFEGLVKSAHSELYRVICDGSKVRGGLIEMSADIKPLVVAIAAVIAPIALPHLSHGDATAAGGIAIATSAILVRRGLASFCANSAGKTEHGSPSA